TDLEEAVGELGLESRSGPKVAVAIRRTQSLSEQLDRASQITCSLQDHRPRAKGPAAVDDLLLLDLGLRSSEVSVVDRGVHKIVTRSLLEVQVTEFLVAGSSSTKMIDRRSQIAALVLDGTQVDSSGVGQWRRQALVGFERRRQEQTGRASVASVVL